MNFEINNFLDQKFRYGDIEKYDFLKNKEEF
jgi:hypothetical protein